MITPPIPEYTQIIRTSHQSHLRVRLYQETGTSPFQRTLVGDLPVASLTLMLDAEADVKRTVDFSFALDPYETQSRDTVEAISTEGGIITIEHGVTYLGIEDVTWVLIATLRVDAITNSLIEAQRAVRAFDRSILPQEHAIETDRPLNDTYANLIAVLLQETLVGEPITFDPRFTSEELALAPTGGKAASEGTQRLTLMQNFAEVMGGMVVNLPDGSFMVRKIVEEPPVWDVDAGEDGVLVEATEETSRREQYNAVSIRWTPDGTNPAEDWLEARILLWDTDPTSPTFYDGPFGKRIIFYEDEFDHLPSQDEAEKIAIGRLQKVSGATRGLSIVAVYNPLLEIGDIINVTFPDGHDEQHIIDTVTLELAPSARMTLETRMKREISYDFVVRNSKGVG